MYRLLDWFEAIRDFLEMGGPVLLVIGGLTLSSQAGEGRDGHMERPG
jgi:hypothetical protein